MLVTNARAFQITGRENPVIIEATITNVTGQVDALVGGSSPVAKRVELDATADLGSPGPTDDGTGMVGMAPMPWWRIDPGETITLRGGSGHLTLVGLDRPVEAGETVEVTFTFQQSPPVVVQVPVETYRD